MITREVSSPTCFSAQIRYKNTIDRVQRLLNKIQHATLVERNNMKKTSLFEFDVASYKKRPIGLAASKKPI